jgi:hypothetical protein
MSTAEAATISQLNGSVERHLPIIASQSEAKLTASLAVYSSV